MTTGGKGSKPRPFSISHQEWMTRWDAIFGRDGPNDFQDILSTEDCVLAAFEEFEERETRNNEETQEAKKQAKN